MTLLPKRNVWENGAAGLSPTEAGWEGERGAWQGEVSKTRLRGDFPASDSGSSSGDKGVNPPIPLN